MFGKMKKNKRNTVHNTQTEISSDKGIKVGDISVNEKSYVEEHNTDGSSSSDSEESVYSGLEEEPDTSEEEDEEESDDESDNESSGSSEEELEIGGLKQEQRMIKGEENEMKSAADIEKTSLVDEYEMDSSDEEDIRNTVGNIPMKWYQEFDHIGYDLLGAKIGKPKSADELDEFLRKMDDPNYWRTVKDEMTGQNVVLSDQDVDIIRRLQKRRYVGLSEDPHAPWVDFFTNTVMQHPISSHPPQKRSFIPSKWEKQKVSRLVHAMKMGWLKPKVVKSEEEEEKERYYLLWEQDDQEDITKRHREHIPAPKLPLPGHEESYNPPPEYLFTEEEELQWKNQESYERKTNFVPQKYSSLRHVPAYSNFVRERFERCLDLYLCPRQRKMKLNINPEDLIPKLPKPKDLQPFPTTQALLFTGHTGLVRCISVDPTGQWMVSGSDDCTIKFWEVSTARCLKTITIGSVVKDIAWTPNASLSIVAVATEKQVIVMNSKLGDKLVISNTDNMINAFTYEDQQSTSSNENTHANWEVCKGSDYDHGFRIRITHECDINQVTWHGKGDYFAVAQQKGGSNSVYIHQLSKRRSQNPFKKMKGMVQCVMFHPVRPFFFVATQRYVRVYNLMKQELAKKLSANAKWISSMAIHPDGDHVIIGSYDCRLSWFDLDLSARPYQTLRHHKQAIRQVCYHKKYPLFASASDDGTIIVCHGMVYQDLLQNPMIVPVKILRGHQLNQDLGVLDCEFHPTQPWIFSSGSDSTIRLYS